MPKHLLKLCFFLLFALSQTIQMTWAQTEISVLDDAQRKISVSKPVQRIISLAPHVTELVFEAGAGAALIGISDYSDYPEQAKKIPSIGNIFALDIERLLALKPDLVIIWGTGNAKLLAQKLRQHQMLVFESEPQNYEMIASSIERIAHLAGTDAIGKKNAQAFRLRLEQIKQRYQLKANETPLNVFYQIGSKPIMSINGKHILAQVMTTCGAKNSFANVKDLVPTLSAEAVIANNPDAIVSSGNNIEQSLGNWLNFKHLKAVQNKHLFVIDGDLLNRSGPRILEGTEQLCKQLASVRSINSKPVKN
jgi:iron complex transport system substrate-binding protein